MLNDYEQALYTLNEFFCHAPNDTSIYVEISYNDMKDSTSYFDYSVRSIPDLCDMIMETIEEDEENEKTIERISISLYPCITKTNSVFDCLLCAGIGILSAEINVIHTHLQPLDFTTLCKLSLIQKFPPSFIVHYSPNLLLLVYHLNEFWRRTCQNARAMDLFLEAYKKRFQETSYGYDVKPITDLDYIFPIPGLLNKQDSINPFKACIYEFDGSQIIPLSDIYAPVRSYSIERFFDAVGYSPYFDIEDCPISEPKIQKLLSLIGFEHYIS